MVRMSEGAATVALREFQRQQGERKRLESLPPEYVVHTVHGTFASKATWIEPDSWPSEELGRLLGWRARIEPFRWCGNNSSRARWQAAQMLAEHLATKLDEFPAAHHVVVAHSHGGNVAFWALREKALAGRVLGVATLATPFLTARLRPNEFLVDFGTAIFAGMFVTWAILFFGVYHGLGLTLLPGASGAGVGMTAALLVAAWLMGRMENYAKRICDRMPATALVPEQVAIIRVQGDEATAAITGVRLAGTLADLLWGVLSAPLYKRLSSLLTIFDYWSVRSFKHKVEESENRKLAALYADVPIAKVESDYLLAERGLTLGESAEGLAKLPNNVAVIIENARMLLSDPSPIQPGETRDQFWHGLVRQAPAHVLAPLVLYLLQGGTIGQTVALGCFLIYGLPAAFSVATVTLGLPFAFLSSVTLLPCGWTLPFTGSYLNLLADSCPPGSWQVTVFEGPDKPAGLFHSQAYQSYEALRFTSQWVKDRAKAFKTGA